MEKAKRIEIAKDVLRLVEQGQPEYGEESWEADIGRFIDKDRFELEKKKLFLERPQLIALTADLPNPGDYYATDIAGKPILIVRNKEGEAKAFLNACRHRGVKLAEGCGHGNGFTCRYHGWTYNTDGALISVPSRQSFEPEQLRGLIALPIAEEMGMILVHADPEGHLDFDEFFGPMKAYLEDFDIPDYELLSEYRAPTRINWKHAVDGGLEAYHVPFLHQNTFGTGGLAQLLHRQFGDHHALIAPRPDILKLKDMPESEWPHSCHFTSTNSIFPNTVIGGGDPVLFFQRTEPNTKDPGVCDYIFRLYGRKNVSPEERARHLAGVDFFMKVSLQEDLPVQRSSQIMMEEGAVPSVLFGKREINLTRMHKHYDAVIGHDNEASVREQKRKMGLAPSN
ncbi:MAG: Rieske (2Fe-2S) protein [Rhodospirillales bacterium]|nr:Rieske (2Fe-2S) protein [Rhodospirillales bacterium]